MKTLLHQPAISTPDRLPHIRCERRAGAGAQGRPEQVEQVASGAASSCRGQGSAVYLAWRAWGDNAPAETGNMCCFPPPNR